MFPPRPLRAARVARPLVLLVGLALAAGACRTTGDPKGPQAALLCGPTRTEVTGTVADAGLDELSGLVLSRRHPGVVWVEEDGGNGAFVSALDERGGVVRRFAVADATNRDWEDIALVARAGAGPDTLVLADAGDNDRTHESATLWLVPEPDVSAPAPPTPPLAGTTAPAQPITVLYPDGAHDVETLLADPRTGDLFLVTKQYDGDAGVYRVPADASPTAPVTATKVATLRLGLGQAATGGDVAVDGSVVVIRTYTDVNVWGRAQDETVAEALAHKPCRATRSNEGQAEAIGLLLDGRGWMTVSESDTPVLRRTVATGGTTTSRP